MSNNDDFDFNRDDLFDDFDDDNSSNDDFSSDDFDFGDDDSDDFNLDDDSFGDDLDSALAGDNDGGDDDDDFGTTENNQSGGGTSRSFMLIAALMAFGMIAGLGIIIYVLFFRTDPADVAFAQTATSISLTNEVAMTQISASATAAIDNATATQDAFIAAGTATEQANIDATASYVPPSPTPTEDLTATAVEATNQVVAAQETTNAQFAIDATNTEVAFQLTLNPVTATPEGGIPTQEGGTGGVSTEIVPEGNTPVPLPAVQQTATALALLFASTPTQSGGEVQATSILDGTGDGGSGGAATQAPSGSSSSGQLPDTGLFDDVFQGNPAFIFLAAFGLLGVIVFSRTVRSRKNEE